MSFVPIYNYTHYSLQFGLSRPKDLVKKCVENGYTACGIADYKTVSGAVSFFKECKKAKIKPIIGCSFDGFKLFARNKRGWLDLIQILSTDSFGLIQEKNLIVSVERKYCTDPDNDGYFKFECGDKAYVFHTSMVVFEDSFEEYFYVNESDADIHRISLSSGMKISIPKIKKKLAKGEEFEHDRFFKSTNFFVPSVDSAVGSEANEEINAAAQDYDILEKPMLPHFPTPNGETEEEYLKALCRKGWKDLLQAQGKVDTDELKQLYHDRFEEEFGVFKDANLFGYFLIVWDVLNFVNSSGWLSGPGRGSAAGCLISYLIGITKIDPIEFDLLMSRFYNAGRNTYDKISFDEFSFEEFEKTCV